MAHVKKCKGVHGCYCVVLFSAFLYHVPSGHVLIRFYCNVLTVVAADCLPAAQLRQGQNTATVYAWMLQVVGLSPVWVALVTEFMEAALVKLLMAAHVQSPWQACHCLQHCCSPMWVITLVYMGL
uniref:Uncharacterized protein n=1 Tax=Rhipicephalus zambeziensis TaxID=60191 RepID=A0A224YH64_9ACAR